MENDLLNIVNDPRNYVLPITNIIGRRINRIATLNNKLTSKVTTLYLIPDGEDKNEICEQISKIMSEIELLILKNIDDTQILEYSLAEFTLKPAQSVEKPSQASEPPEHTYFA